MIGEIVKLERRRGKRGYVVAFLIGFGFLALAPVGPAKADPTDDAYLLAKEASQTANVVLRTSRAERALELLAGVEPSDLTATLLKTLIHVSVVPYTLPDDTILTDMPPDVQASIWQLVARAKMARDDRAGALRSLKKASAFDPGTPLGKADSLLEIARYGYREGIIADIDSILAEIEDIWFIERQAVLRRIALACYHMSSSHRTEVLRRGWQTTQEIVDDAPFTKALKGYFMLFLAAHSDNWEERSLLGDEGTRLLTQAAEVDSQNPVIKLMLARSSLLLSDRPPYPREELTTLLQSVVKTDGGPEWMWGDEILFPPRESLAIALVELGMALKVSGDPEAARSYFERALEVAPGGRALDEARKQLMALGVLQ